MKKGKLIVALLVALGGALFFASKLHNFRRPQLPPQPGVTRSSQPGFDFPPSAWSTALENARGDDIDMSTEFASAFVDGFHIETAGEGISPRFADTAASVAPVLGLELVRSHRTGDLTGLIGLMDSMDVSYQPSLPVLLSQSLQMSPTKNFRKSVLDQNGAKLFAFADAELAFPGGEGLPSMIRDGTVVPDNVCVIGLTAVGEDGQENKYNFFLVERRGSLELLSVIRPVGRVSMNFYPGSTTFRPGE